MRAAVRWGASMAVGAVVLALTSACGGAPSERTGEATASPSSTSAAFEVAVPDGWTLITAGMGAEEPLWGDDSGGTDEPVTLLTDGVTVSFTGYVGYQGGLGQASRARPGDEGVRTLRVDGHDAIFAPTTWSPAGSGPAELLVDRGDDLAVRASGPGRSLEELEQIVAAVAPTDRHDRAPALAVPPLGLEVLAQADVQGAIAAHGGYVAPGFVAGGSSSHSLGWLDGAEQLLVLAVPGRSLPLEAAPALFRGRDVVPRGSGDRSVVVVGGSDGDATVFVESGWGDTLVAWSSSMPVDQLIEVATSARAVDDDRWEVLVEEAAGGPGLQPDPTRTELARGEADGVAWLLQSGGPGSLRSGGSGGLGSSGPGALPDPEAIPDECLKLEDGARACPVGTFEAAELRVATIERPAMAIVTVRGPGSTLRLTRSDGSTTSTDLVPIPAHDTRAGVLVGTVGFPRLRCTGPIAGAEVRAEVLDEAGAVLRCLEG